MRPMLTLVASLVFSNLAVAASVEEDVERNVQIFSGEKNLHTAGAADVLIWMGLSDTRLFDIIERRLLEDADAARGNRNEKNRVARYIRSLGYSGQSKYESTMKKFVGDADYGRYAQEALLDLPVYKNWNSIISNRSSFDPKLSDDANRISNMLRSGDLLLQRIGAKRVYHGADDAKDDAVLEILAQQVRANYARKDLNNPDRSDSVAWLVKALGSSKKGQYKALLEEVADKASAPPVVKHAKEALYKYYGRPYGR
jgi:hypothetical protein